MARTTDSTADDATDLTQTDTAGVEDRLASLFDDDGEIGTNEDEAQAPEPTGTQGNDGDDEEAEVQTDDAGTDSDTAGEQDEGDADEADADEQDDTSDNAPPQTFKVKVRGKEEDVPLPELLAGYSRTADYTRSKQELAEQRRALESEATAVQQERAFYAANLAKLKEAAEAALGAEPDWDTLRDTDPVEYGVQYAEWTRKQKKLDAIRAEQSRITAQQQAEQQKQMAAYIEQERAKLYEAMPEWKKDSARAEKELGLIRGYGKQIGFTDDELDAAADSRAVIVLNKARMWDELQARTAKIKEKVRPVGKTLPAGSQPPQKARSQGRKQYQDRRAQLRRSGSMDDAARALELILDD